MTTSEGNQYVFSLKKVKKKNRREREVQRCSMLQILISLPHCLQTKRLQGDVSLCRQGSRKRCVTAPVCPLLHKQETRRSRWLLPCSDVSEGTVARTQISSRCMIQCNQSKQDFPLQVKAKAAAAVGSSDCACGNICL